MLWFFICAKASLVYLIRLLIFKRCKNIEHRKAAGFPRPTTNETASANLNAKTDANIKGETSVNLDGDKLNITGGSKIKIESSDTDIL